MWSYLTPDDTITATIVPSTTSAATSTIKRKGRRELRGVSAYSAS